MQKLLTRSASDWACDFQREFQAASPRELDEPCLSDVYITEDEVNAAFSGRVRKNRSQYGLKKGSDGVLWCVDMSPLCAKKIIQILQTPNYAPIKILEQAVRTGDVQMAYMLGMRFLHPLFRDREDAVKNSWATKGALLLEYAALNGHGNAGQMLGHAGIVDGVAPLSVSLAWAVKTLPPFFLVERLIELACEKRVCIDQVWPFVEEKQRDLCPVERQKISRFVNDKLRFLMTTKCDDDKFLAERVLELINKREVCPQALAHLTHWRLHACQDARTASSFLITLLQNVSWRDLDKQFSGWARTIKQDFEKIRLSSDVTPEQHAVLAQLAPPVR